MEKSTLSYDQLVERGLADPIKEHHFVHNARDILNVFWDMMVMEGVIPEALARKIIIEYEKRAG